LVEIFQSEECDVLAKVNAEPHCAPKGAPSIQNYASYKHHTPPEWKISNQEQSTKFKDRKPKTKDQLPSSFIPPPSSFIFPGVV
jgi:hypothetical protein